ncbi:MAG TPA: HAMP domain-containing sensor histidine kinase, partial [Rhodothermales bacterium]|nr:HAMP domain-containing sensor histidine kinase [Rhodothermales bacterium]
AHSRGNAGVKEAVDVNALLEEYTNLAYHGMRAQRPDFTCTIERAFDASPLTVQAVPQDLSRVVLNLVGNALYAVADRKARLNGQSDGGAPSDAFVPTIRVSTRAVEGAVEVVVWDNGGGIPEAVRKKIFEPFFTTKPAGEGTGLGLSLSHDIVAAHGGTLVVESGGEETTFTLTLLPVRVPEPATR